MTLFDRHLQSARGYLELGLALEADAEIESIEPPWKTHPRALEVRAAVFQALGRWAMMETVCRQLCAAEPDESRWPILLAHALAHTAPGSNAAMGALMNALLRFPEEPTIHYALACYEVQRGNLDLARRWLHEAVRLAPVFRRLALANSDLAVLHDEPNA